MPRFVYAIVALLAVVALVARAQPFVADMTHEDSFQIMEEAPYGGTNDENTTLYYASVEVPWNAWRVAVNLTGPPCVDYSLQPPGPAAGPDIDFMVAPYLPCSYYFSNFYVTVVKGSGLPVPNVLCYFYGANGKLLYELDNWFSYPWTTQGVVASADLDSATLSTDPVNVIYARAVGINPRPFYVAAGRINYSADLQTTCNFTFSADVQVAPPGTLIANITSGEPAFAPYQNITLMEGNKTVNAAPITTQSVVFYIPEIPAGTVYLAVNITVDSSITGLNAYGASYAITSNPRKDECYSGDGTIYTSGSISIYEIICFSPRAFEPYYVNVDAGFGVVTQINASFAAVVCPAGLYGPSCDEPVFAFDLNGPSTQLFNGTTAANGVVHFYFDWPANTWNTTLFIARERNISLTNNILAFREGSYTSVNQEVFGIYPYSTSGFFWNSNLQDAPYSSTAAPYAFASTPYERYLPHTSRWVWTYVCTGNVECYYDMEIYTSASSLDIPAPIPVPKAPVGKAPPAGAPFDTGSPVAPGAPTAPNAPGSPTGSPSSGTPTGSPSSANVLAPLSALVLALLALAFF